MPFLSFLMIAIKLKKQYFSPTFKLKENSMDLDKAMQSNYGK